MSIPFALILSPVSLFCPGSALGRHLMVFDGERERMAAYRFGGLEGTLLRLGESGQMSMIG